MARKRKWKECVGRKIYEKRKLDRKFVTIEKSFQEVRRLLGDGKK